MFFLGGGEGGWCNEQKAWGKLVFADDHFECVECYEVMEDKIDKI